jgi:hypothetical protein
MDCEGYEADLLVPEVLCNIERTVILVEIHDFIRPGIETRFIHTHKITVNITRLQKLP